MSEENIHKEHRARLKQRFMEKGLQDFAPHNVLELLLFYAIPRKDTNEIGHKLINKFGSLSAVFDAPIEEIIAVEGMGENSAMFLKLMPEVAKKYLTDEKKNIFLNSTQKAGEFFMPIFLGDAEENIYVACLDAKAKLLKCQHIHRGNFNAVEVSIRKIAQVALTYNATGVILAHNHPSGVALPSQEDHQTTLKVKEGLNALNIKLYDHIVVGDNDYVSYADTYPNWR